MAQFDVHLNPGPRRAHVPCVVGVQSSLFDDYRRRLVVPLVRPPAISGAGHPRVPPLFEIEGERVVLHPLDMVSVDLRQLGPRMASLADAGQAIIDAPDEVFTSAFS